MRDRAHDEIRLPRESPAAPPPPPIWPPPDGRLRVGFVGPCYLTHGGTETWHRTLLPRLDSARVQVVGYAVDTLAPDAASLPCPVGTGREAMRSLARAVDVLVVWGKDDLGSVLPTARRPHVVWVSHGEGNWTRAMAAGARTWVDHYVAVSATARTVVPDPDAAALIPNAIDPDRTRPSRARADVRAALGLNPDHVAVFAPHRLSSEKRVSLLADAIDRLGPPYVLVVAGDGPERARLENRPAVRLLGVRSDLGDLYAAADLFVSASEHDGFGLSTAEAMAAGLPVLSTPVGFLTEHPDLARIVPHDAGAAGWAAAIRSEWDALDTRHLPPVFVLNLDRRPDRWASIRSQLEHFGIPYERIAAVDARALNLPPLPAGTRPGNVGSTLSHRDAWRRLLDSNADRALILEDDAGLCPDFLGRLNRLMREPCLPDVVKLGWYGAGYCDHAYLISRAGAARLLAMVDPLAAPCDDQVFHLYHKTWTLCDPPLAVALPWESDITPFGPAPSAAPALPSGPRQRIDSARRFVADRYDVGRHVAAWVDRIRSLAPPPPEPVLPRLRDQARGFVASAGAVIAHAVTTGEVLATPEVRAAREATCAACEFYRSSDHRCGGSVGCGCWTPLKTRFAAATCPRARWPS